MSPVSDQGSLAYACPWQVRDRRLISRGCNGFAKGREATSDDRCASLLNEIERIGVRLERELLAGAGDS